MKNSPLFIAAIVIGVIALIIGLQESLADFRVFPS